MPEVQGKKKIREIDATPESRDIFNSLSRGGYSLSGAVEEYIDNAIDQAIHQAFQDRKEIKVRTSQINQQNATYLIEIEDNCGGCRVDDAVRFIRPGMSGSTAASESISTFGIGGKAAGLAVSSKVVITSRYRGENAWQVTLDKREISSKQNWRFQVLEFLESDFKESSTIVTLYLEQDKIRDFANFSRDIRESVKKRYSAFLADKVSISLDNTKVETGNPYSEILGTPFAPQDCEPVKVSKNFRIPYRPSMSNEGITEVTIQITMGLHQEGSNTQEFGSNIYCNGRLLKEYDKVGLNKEKGAPGRDVTWLRAVVEITGSNEAMPWNNRKDALDPSSPAFSKLNEFLTETYEKYLGNLDDAKQHYKARTGKKNSYGAKDLIEENYAKLMKKHKNDASFFPDYIKKTAAYRDAIELSEKPPSPPGPDPSTTNLSAKVETDKVEIVREKIRELKLGDNVRNTDIVRELLDHYLRCVVKPKNKETVNS